MNYINDQIPKIQEYLETSLKQPKHLHLIIEGPPNFKISELTSEKLDELLSFHPEYDELQYMRDNGVEIFSCEVTTDGCKIEKMGILPWRKG